MIIKDKKVIVYDIEVLRNCFTCTLCDTESNDIITYEISNRKNDLSNIIKFFKSNYYFCGYNNKHYDDPIINYILSYYDVMIRKNYYEVCQSIFNLSQVIINSNDDGFDKWRTLKYANLFSSFDLLMLYFSKALRVSLKEMQISMMYKNVQEFVFDWNSYISDKDIDKLIQYNINDVQSTTELLHKTVKDIELRLDIEKEYGLDVLSKDGMKIGISILEKIYSEHTGIKKELLRQSKSLYKEIPLKDIILPIIEFKDKKLKALLDRMKEKVLINTKSEFKEEVIFDGVKYVLGTGGIHTKDSPGIIESTDEFKIIDSDVASYYPSLLINWEFYPKHLGKAFIDVYKHIYNERLSAKRNGNKTVAETLKLALNGTYGNLINEHSWLYDRKAAMSITINGQLLLLMLAERLTEVGCKIISANTDGLTYSARNGSEEYLIVCNDWEKYSKMNLEHVCYSKIIRYAVNDYIAIKEGFDPTSNNSKDYLKEKGIFITNPRLGKGLTPLIIPKAIQAYFLYGIPVKKFVMSAIDIKDFLMAEKTGKQWFVEHNGVLQQRTNRFYAAVNKPYLWKYKFVKDNEGNDMKSYSNMLVGFGVSLLNSLEGDKIPIEEYGIDYRYYLREINKLINEIEPKQLSLF